MRRLSRQDAKKLFEELQSEGKDESLPIRSLIHYSLSGSIKTGRIYARSETETPAVVFFNLLEYTKFQKGLFASVYAENEQEFRDGMKLVWDENQPESLVLVLNRKFKDEAYNHLQPSGKHVSHLGPFHVFINAKPESDVISTKCGPKETLEISALTSSEARELTQEWDYEGVPNTEDFFEFMAANFPQACVRNEVKCPVAWVMEYPVGGLAAQYTMPEYRKLGLATTLRQAVYTLHEIMSSVPLYSTVAEDNEPAIRLNEKMGARRAEVQFTWVIAGEPPKESSEEDSEEDEESEDEEEDRHGN